MFEAYSHSNHEGLIAASCIEKEVRFGSKGEILAASRCFPLFSQHRTFGGAMSATVNLQDLSDLQLDR